MFAIYIQRRVDEADTNKQINKHKQTKIEEILILYAYIYSYTSNKEHISPHHTTFRQVFEFELGVK